LIRRKKEIKRVFFVVLLIITIFLSTVQIINTFDGTQDKKSNHAIILDKSPIISDLDDIISGSGDNQNVRVYGNNQSENLQNNEDYFEIPALPTEDMYLSYGNFSFQFQNNFTAEYVLEDDDALYAEDFVSFDYNTGSSGIVITNGTVLSGGFGRLIDNDQDTNIYINALNGLLNFTISADFTGTTYSSTVISDNVEFNRSRILGLISSLLFRIYKNANLTVRIKDFSQSNWIEVISNLPIDSTLNKQYLTEHFINENLNFIDLTSICYIQFIFERYDSSQFYARLYEYDLQATYAFDLPISNQKYVALEFDLKGEKSTVNGFYAWIRTLDLVEAATSQLNISLYRANATLVRTIDNLRDISLGPDYNEMIDTRLVSYTGDSLNYFAFDIGNTANLNLYNYFIVIKSNNSKEVYSLVALPYYDYGDDGLTEHQLKRTFDNGVTWRNAKKVIETIDLPYKSGQLDASSFKLNVTRGYMPSDFILNDNQTLRIQDLPLENLEINTYPYNESSYLTWGLGQWDNSFLTAIEEEITNVFRVDLRWNRSIIKGFKFNVSYSINAYWVESASSTYHATYNKDPEWLFNYNFNKNNPSFEKWKFIEFWYIFLDYFTANNVTNPNNQEILPSGTKQTALVEDQTKDKIIVQSDLATQSGIYILNLTSYNFIHDTHSYINYKGTLWESNGFMDGDNMSVSVVIQDHNFNAPKSGNANATVFYPDGTKVSTAELYSPLGIIKDSSLIYDFDNQTIFEITNALTVSGEYHLGFFWFNGSAIGCKKIIIYIDTYDLELYSCEYYPSLKSNVLDGEIKNKVFNNYTMLIASINETTGISLPNYYPIDYSDINNEYSHIIGDEELPVLMTSFKQSQEILNPNEIINIKTSIQNLHPFIPLKVKINVKLVSFMNEEWIIAETTSSNSILNFSGHPTDTNEFDIDLTIPDLNVATNEWQGVNAPIRLGGAKTLITIFIENVNVGVFESPDILLLSNETNNNFEGNILGLRVAEETSSRTILYEFNRDECLYKPNSTLFLVNIIDQNYVSSYNQFTDEFSLILNSKFTNITINPYNPIKGQSFNISSILTTEFGDELSSKNVSCQYYDSGVWINIGSDNTDSNGFTTFLINTKTIDFKGDLLLRLSWDGDIINGFSKNVTVHIIHQSNNLTISIISNHVLIFRQRQTFFTISLSNIGDSNLRITNISINLNRNQEYSIVQIDYILLSWFPAGESSIIIVEVSVKNVNRVVVSISITAQNIITNETIMVSKERTYYTFEISILEYILQNFTLIAIVIIILSFIIAIIYARKTKKRIETPIEEPTLKKPRRAKYVPVAELKKPKPVKKPVKKKEEPKEKEKEKIDLDSLLEERGLTDDKNKSEK